MDKLLKRENVKSSDKWDLESVYKTLDDYNKDYNLVKDNIDKLNKMQNTFLKSSTNFKDLLLLDSKTSRLIEKLYTYSARKYDEDTGNSKYQELYGKMNNLYQKKKKKTAYLVPTILKQDKNMIINYLEQEKDLENFKHQMLDILRYKDHSLTNEEEKIVTAFSKVISSSGDTADYLMDTDMTFGSIKDENNKDVELTSSNYSLFLHSKDRKVRKEAFTNYHNVYGSFKNTLTSTLATTCEALTVESKLKNFSSSLETCLFNDFIPTSLYDNLIKVVHDNLPSLYKYYDIKKKLLNLDEFHLYDGYVSTIKDIKEEYNFKEGEKLVKEALSVLGEEYSKELSKAFNEGYIDKYPNLNKRSGAYSSGSYDTKPFVLLNYTSEYNDVSTLAHELGHSMHTYFSSRNSLSC